MNPSQDFRGQVALVASMEASQRTHVAGHRAMQAGGPGVP
jgi:hypothetical protein